MTGCGAWRPRAARMDSGDRRHGRREWFRADWGPFGTGPDRRDPGSMHPKQAGGSRPRSRRKIPMTQPRVATSAAALTELLAGIAHVDGDRFVIDDEARVPRRRHPGHRLERDVQRGRGHRRGGALDGLGGVAGARRSRRRASTTCTWPAVGARCTASRCPPSTSGPRCSTWPGSSPRRPRPSTPARSSSSSLAASRSTPSSAPASTSRACSRAPSRPAGRVPCSSRATTTSSTPRSTRRIRRA